MNSFEFVRPASLDAAIAAAAAPGAAFLAGGTNLVDLMKGGIGTPMRLVDIRRLPGLDRIERLPDGAVRIGATVRNADLAADPAFRKTFPMVAEALLAGASPQLRNSATVGGNLMQRTRCAYFYDLGSRCNRREAGAGCDAIGGEGRGQAILGASGHCVATHPSDLCVPLVALGAIVEVEGRDGAREIPLDEFHKVPGETPEIETVLAPGELIVAVRLPAEAAAFAAHSRYLKVRDRMSYAFALASCAAALQIENGIVSAARIGLGGVATKPWRARGAEARAVGARVDDDAAFSAAAALAFEDASASEGAAFKIELGQRTVARALRLAAAGAPNFMPALPGSPFALAE